MTRKRIKSFYFLLLPLFFVFNGYRQHYPVVPVMDVLRLLAVYTIASLIIFFLLPAKTKRLATYKKLFLSHYASYYTPGY